MEQLSPMMQKYVDTKKEYKDCILFYRLGDFYEMFFDDAILVSRELEITLTGKECGLSERAPMCGVPHHSLEIYLNRLVNKGYKVAIAEQVEDPKFAKGLVKREVTKIVTPGTNVFYSNLSDSKNNYLMSIVSLEDSFGISTCDLSTGDYYVTEVKNIRAMLDEINKYMPTEIICNSGFLVCGVDITDIKEKMNISLFSLDSWYFDDEGCKKILMDHFKVQNLFGLGLSDYNIGILAAGSLLSYLYETQKTSLSHLTSITPYTDGYYMVLDTFTRKNLELTETLRDKQKRGSLLHVLDKTKTAMGARLLRSYVEKPLLKRDSILKRQSGVLAFLNNMISREEIREYLNPVYDLERLIGKISYKSATPRDLISFMNSLKMVPHIKNVLKEFDEEYIKEIQNEMDNLSDISDLIQKSIFLEPSLTLKDGNIINDGYSPEVDRLRSAKTEGKNWLADLENFERERTGIKTLKIKYNKVFGYCIEITNSYKDSFIMPEDYTRKQTLSNAERYITPKLKELEDTILGAEDKLFSLEYDLFTEIRDEIATHVKRIQTTAKAIAKIDVLTNLSYISEKNNYVLPEINETGILDIKGGRHPVVEKMISNDMFVSNDTFLDNSKNKVAIITGPNMAGKSTYMRQTALIVLMAQIGSFVPADSANICICDRIFTRVGASDDLASGQSTFMVEMTEVANILRNATPNSLLILDEIGRGTSTFDGLSIAWSVVEYIINNKSISAKTLFATHYHELTELEGMLSGVNNYCIAVKESGDDIVFLRKIVKGGADNSYGIQVARLAGVPDAVIIRAKEIVSLLDDADILKKAKEIAATSVLPVKKKKETFDELDLTQMSLFDTVTDKDIVSELLEIDLSNSTPMDAMNALYKLQNKLKNRW